jgi:DNA-binding LacI/PurR family transcriptional regulator
VRLAGAGVPAYEELVEVGDFTHDGGRAAMERLLERAPGLDAVFVASDLMAVGAVGALRASGRLIPADVAVVGFDDSQLAATTEPGLSSVRQPIEEMGREMTRLLIQEIKFPGRAPRRVILDTELVVRGSSAADGTTDDQA